MAGAAAKSSFQELIESVEALPLDDQQILMDIFAKLPACQVLLEEVAQRAPHGLEFSEPGLRFAPGRCCSTPAAIIHLQQLRHSWLSISKLHSPEVRGLRRRFDKEMVVYKA
jgi:hypothetical protein